MAYGRPQVVIHYRDGQAVYAGELRGMEAAGGIMLGAAMGDFNGYDLALTGEENLYARFLVGATNADPFVGLTSQPIVVEGT